MSENYGQEVLMFFHNAVAQGVFEKQMATRTSNALVRDGYDTMEKVCEVCAVGGETLQRVRNLGEKGRAAALTARDMYIKEKR